MTRNERGLTLIELLVTLSLVGIVSILIISAFISTIKNVDRAMDQNYLRSQVIVLIENLNQLMENIDEINLEESVNVHEDIYTKVTLIDRKRKIEADGSINESIHTYTLELNNGDLLYDGKKLNDNNMTMEQSTLHYGNEKLTVRLVACFITDCEKHLKFNISYPMSGG